MRRRDFVAGLGAAAWPLAAGAQPRQLPVVGYLSGLTEEADRPVVAGYHRGLGEQGYVEGRNVEILYRHADRQLDHFQSLAEDLVRNRVSVICVGGVPPRSLEAAKAASAMTPFVFLTGVDPVQSGLVASLNRPGGSATGATFLTVELAAKRLELLHEVAPAVTSIGILTLPGAAPVIAQAEAQRVPLGFVWRWQLQPYRARSMALLQALSHKGSVRSTSVEGRFFS